MGRSCKTYFRVEKAYKFGIVFSTGFFCYRSKKEVCSSSFVMSHSLKKFDLTSVQLRSNTLHAKANQQLEAYKESYD